MRRIVVDRSELTILDEEGRFTVGELAAGSGLPESDVRALVDLGAFEGCAVPGTEPVFAGRALPLARAAARLAADFGLDSSGMALALAYLERIAALEARVREFECLVPLACLRPPET